MKFPVQTMRDIGRTESDDYAVVLEEPIDTGRWTIQYEVIFKDLTTGK